MADRARRVAGVPRWVVALAAAFALAVAGFFILHLTGTAPMEHTM